MNPSPTNSEQYNEHTHRLYATGQSKVAEWYHKYVSRYLYNPELFCREALSFDPTWQQMQLIDCIVDEVRVACRSGHGTGKSRCMASLMLWFLTCRPFARVLATAPNISILQKVLWPELASGFYRLQQTHPPISKLFGITRTQFFSQKYPQEWFAVARTARKESSQGIAGQHANHFLVIVEEASAVDEDIFEVLDGALTGGDQNKIVMVGNPTSLHGRFYEAFNSKADSYHQLHWDGEESPLVSEDMIKLFREEYGDKSREYMVRVKGEFPPQVSGYLLSRSEINPIPENEVVFDVPPMRIISVDVAGSGRDSSVIMVLEVNHDHNERKVKIVEIREYQIGMDTVDLANEVAFLARSFPCRIIVDSIGVGQGVSDTLTHQEIQHIALNWGMPSWFKDRFQNQRAESYHMLRECLNRRQLSCARHPKLFDQLANLPYGYTDRGKLAMWPKERMLTKGIKSPDLADSLAQSFLVAYEALEPYNEDEEQTVSPMYNLTSAPAAASQTAAADKPTDEDAFNHFLNTDW